MVMNKAHFVHQKFHIWNDLLSLSGVAVAIYLVINELIEPGYCPRYPVVEIPACYLVLVFFSIVYSASFVSSIQLANLMFYTASILGIATAVWFSVNHLLNRLQCPVLLEIPLCFAALFTFLALIIVGFIGYPARKDSVKK